MRASPPPAPARLPAAVFALGLTSFFTDVGAEMIFPLLPGFLAALGGGPAFLGLVEGVADATMSFLQLASGWASDRAPRKKAIVLGGYTLSSLARPLMGLATSPWHVLFVRAADRVGKGVRTAPRDVLIASVTPEGQSGRAYGLHRAMDHAGAVTGPVVAALLLRGGVELRTVFLASLVPGAAAVLSLLLVREPRVPGKPPAASQKSAASRLPAGLRRYLVVVGVFALGSASDAFLLLRASEVGVPVAQLPALWIVLNVSKLVCSYVGGGLADRTSRVRLIVIGWGVYALVYAALAHARAPVHVWALFALLGVHYGLTEPAEKALVRALAPEGVRGRAFGAFHFLLGVSAVPAGLLRGALWQQIGSKVALLAGAALAITAAIALAWIAPGEKPDGEDARA